MRRDPLLSLSRLRRLEVDEAKRDLGRTVSAAMRAMAEAQAAEARIDDERRTATEDASQAQAFATWVPVGRALAQDRAAEATSREAESDVERERLAAARAAERTVEELAESRAALQRIEAMRRIQAVADEIAADRARRRNGGPGFSEPQRGLRGGRRRGRGRARRAQPVDCAGPPGSAGD